jgi:hypothetical protein
MTGLDLLETYPRAAEEIAEFYRSKMIESLNTQDVPDEFKEMIKDQEFDNQYIATFIDANPRILFDVFDSNAVYIEILMDYTEPDPTFTFTYTVIDGDIVYSNSTQHNNRIEAERAAIEQAFQILNDKL